MTVFTYARRVGASAIATVALAATCVACSSSNNGSGQPATSTPALSASVPPVPSVSASLPGATVTAGPGGAGGSASKSAFCKDFRGAQAKLGNLSGGNPGDIAKVVAFFDKLAADAPSDIKADAQKFDSYLHQAAHNAAHFTQAPTGSAGKSLQKLITYVTTNCS